MRSEMYDKAFDVVDELRSCGVKCAFAESLTGGMISSGIVDIAGASDVFEGAVVSYSNEVKINVLGVSRDTIDSFTAVSEQCAIEMAEGVRKLTGADITVSATGYAGSLANEEADLYDGINSDNEDGTVYIGFSSEDGTYAVCQYFPGGREAVRTQTALFAYDMILEYLRENYE